MSTKSSYSQSTPLLKTVIFSVLKKDQIYCLISVVSLFVFLKKNKLSTVF